MIVFERHAYVDPKATAKVLNSASVNEKLDFLISERARPLNVATSFVVIMLVASVLLFTDGLYHALTFCFPSNAFLFGERLARASKGARLSWEGLLGGRCWAGCQCGGWPRRLVLHIDALTAVL